MSTGEAVSPVSGAERLHSVDVVRGAAILGILVVNMGLFFSPIYLELLGPAWFDSGLDRIVKKGIVGFAQGKFYTIFSILFGFGLAIQLERFRARGMSFGNFWLRRMVVLLCNSSLSSAFAIDSNSRLFHILLQLSYQSLNIWELLSIAQFIDKLNR